MLDQPAGELRKCTRLLSIRRSVILMIWIGRPITWAFIDVFEIGM